MSQVPTEDWQDPDRPDHKEVFDAAMDAMAALVVDADQTHKGRLATAFDSLRWRGGS